MKITIQAQILRLSKRIFIFLILFSLCACTNIGQNHGDREAELSDVIPDSLSAADSIKLAYDYSTNGKEYQLTFLEFGFVGCRECKKMEMVMDSVRNAYGEKVRVVFYNVKNNRKMTQHFGIDVIPAQVLLDRTGLECYRHIGYLPFAQLEQQIVKYGKK